MHLAIQENLPVLLKQLMCGDLNKELEVLYGRKAVPSALAEALRQYCRDRDNSV